MATGRERRAERLNERLRGAQRVNVDDDTFNLDIASLDQPAEAAAARQTPNTSAKRRRVGPRTSGPASQRKPASFARSAARDDYALPDSSKESVAAARTAGPPSSTRGRRRGGAVRANARTGSAARSSVARSSVARSSVARSSVARSSVAQDDDDDDSDDPDALESLPPSAVIRSPVRTRVLGVHVDEIAESPADAPGSGRRRTVQSSGVTSSTARLQEAVNAEESSQTTSSPLARKTRQSDAAVSSRSATASRIQPSRLVEFDAEDDAEEEQQEEEVDEIEDAEAARVLGRKRPRRSMQERSPELGSGPMDDEEEPAPKRKRGRPSKSPATQKQPAPKKQKLSSVKSKRGRKPKSSSQPKPTARADADADEEGNEAQPIEITVQRLVNVKGNDMDALSSAIPFANRSGESVVDVLAQVCEEVIETTLSQYEELEETAADLAHKKECRVKRRAIEAFREELSTRLLQHAIHLNHWHSLRKRVRAVQKEKLGLREEILRLKAEREQVALRMDAIRIKHEAESKDVALRLNTSSLMHDIELAVGQGQDAPELSRADQKKANLANLELVVAQVADQASSSGSTGGLLNQVKDFNAFLERAAIALETR